MTAAAPALDDEQLVAARHPMRSYVARRQNLRLTRTPIRTILDSATGREVGRTEGQTLQFLVWIDPRLKDQLVSSGMEEREAQAAARFGRVDIPLEGEVVLEGGMRADAGEIHDWLSKHRLVNDQWEGFWALVPAAPQVSQAELDRLTSAAVAHDVETLERIVEQERAGWNRDQLVVIAQRSIDQIRAAAKQPAKGK